MGFGRGDTIPALIRQNYTTWVILVVNLGLLLEHKDGLRVPKFGVPPGGPHLMEFRFMAGGGSNLPVHFVAFPCAPFVGELP